MDHHRTIPSMYHRRLLLIAAVMTLVVLVLGAQLARLTVVEGAQRLERAEERLHRRSLLPTFRGSILDRAGRRLAVDRPGYALALRYEVITDQWAISQARHQAIRRLGRSTWYEMSPEQRERAIHDRRPAWSAKTRRLYQEICRLGEISQPELERRLDAIRGEVQSLAAAVWQRQRASELARYGGDDESFAFRPGKIREQMEAHVVLPNLSDEVAFAFRALANDLPGMFEVREARRREYPWSAADVRLDRSSLPRPLQSSQPLVVHVEGVADHILGSVRVVQAEDVERRPFRNPQTGEVDLGGYRSVDDRAGAFGLERVFEDHLRGVRGEIRRRVDVEGERRTQPRPGDDLNTTLDIVLQARLQAILSHEFGLTVVQPFHRNEKLPAGWPLNSAAVILEIETGEVLALVSMPTRAMADDLGKDRLRLENPWVNRAIEAVYPPGSIIKPLVLTAAVTEGVHRLDQTIECTGHYFPGRDDIARCWIYREKWGFATHGPLPAEDAVARSCNIFFYTLADRLGIERISRWYRRFGLGSVLHVGLEQVCTEPNDAGEPRTVRIGEAGGTVPDADEIAEIRRAGREAFDTIILGIGQGPITWTPLQAANAYATIARGGVVRDATLLVDDPRGTRPKRCGDLSLDPRAVQAALEGLRRSVMEHYGTGHHIRYADHSTEPIFNAKGVTIWGKTGTAQAPPLDLNGDHEIAPDEEGFDHAWFVGLVGPNDTRRPMFAIAVIVEYGGSGGRVAGPIANQIIHALQHEGYLPAVEFTQVRRSR